MNKSRMGLKRGNIRKKSLEFGGTGDPYCPQRLAVRGTSSQSPHRLAHSPSTFPCKGAVTSPAGGCSRGRPVSVEYGSLQKKVAVCHLSVASLAAGCRERRASVAVSVSTDHPGWRIEAQKKQKKKSVHAIMRC